MVINITAGTCLNSLLQKKYPSLTFIPFNEGMILGDYSYPYFDEAFINHRAHIHQVTPIAYQEHLKEFLAILEDLTSINHLVLWFGSDEFCLKNVAFLKELLKDRSYTGTLLGHTVDELTGDIIQTNRIII